MHKTRWRITAPADDPSHALLALSALLRIGAEPDEVRWHVGGETQAGLFDDVDPDAPPPPEPAPMTALRRLPPGFLPLARQVALHAAPSRFRDLHQLALRLHADPRHWQDTLDPLRLALDRMAREVAREIHKMHAFVRFRVVPDAASERRVAWFEPTHHIVRAAAPFFLKRFAGMRWSILTPQLCVHWDLERLRFAPGADRTDAPPADAGEALWLDYYRSIFNPSRLKTAAMTREMPRRYWHNLPEAQAISALVHAAPERSARMQAHASTVLRRPPMRSAPPAPPQPADARAARLHDLRSRARHCSECPLASPATQLVWGEGAPDASLMVVGEQPGDQEDLAGRPFVGPAGQLLRTAFAQLGWPMSALYLTNAVKHFHYELRGKRRIHKTPGQQHALACAKWLDAEIAQVRPRALLALGGTAASSLLGRPLRLSDCLGQWLHRDDGLPVWVVHHPAAVLRRAESGAPSFESWVKAMRPAFEAGPPTPPAE